MPTNQDLTAKYEEERLRTHEQSQIVYLQGQVDELRRLIKDQTNKYNLVVEQVRRNEAIVNQVQGLFERHADETNRAIEASRRDIVALRTEIANALVKIDEGIRPLRDMQAQIHQLGEARKQDREYVLSWFRRIEELEQKLAGYQSQIKNIDDRERQLALQLDRLREADALAIQEARRVSEELQVEKQGLRRQAVEAQQLVADVHSILEDHNSRIQRLDEIRQHIDLFAETLPGQIVEISNRLPDFTTEIKRVERISTERFLMNQERLEELRHQADEKLDVLQETDEQHLRQLTAWLERTDSWLRELEQRVARSTARYEEVQQGHIARILELERRELRMINALAVAFNSQAEVTQADQIASRKDGEQPT